MMRVCLILIAILGCSKPTRDDRCRDAADHLGKISKFRMGATDRERVLASCATWPEDALDCLLAAKDDPEIKRCQSKLE